MKKNERNRYRNWREGLKNEDRKNHKERKKKGKVR